VIFKFGHKPVFFNLFGEDNPNTVAKWMINGVSYCEVVNKLNGTTTGGWMYEAS
jgi:hypothetical protein